MLHHLRFRCYEDFKSSFLECNILVSIVFSLLILFNFIAFLVPFVMKKSIYYLLRIETGLACADLNSDRVGLKAEQAHF